MHFARPLAAALALVATTAAADIVYLGVGALPGTTLDQSGLTQPLLNNATGAVEMPHNRAGGWGSAIAYTGAGDRYIVTPDRGPADGATSYIDRFYELDVRVTQGAGGAWSVTPNLVGTQLMRSGGDFFTGSSAAIANGLRFDPEGVAVSGSGRTIFVSDEYGPFIYEFDRATGQRVRTIELPAKFKIANPSPTAATELTGNTSGRQANRGMEGLTISPDGTKLYGIMQSPLIQDGALSGTTRVGQNNRLVEIDLATGKTREFVYQMEIPAGSTTTNLGVSEILAINDHQFLVLERDGRGFGRENPNTTANPRSCTTAGAGCNDARFKRVYQIDLAGATDVSNIASLPTLGLPGGVTAVSKSLFFDVLAKTGLNAFQFPEKLEGLAWGPSLPDGRLLLLLTVDNDFADFVPGEIFAFAVDPSSVPGFERQRIPEPGGLALVLAAGLAAVATRRRAGPPPVKAGRR
jgi:hypothetical protein